MKNKKLADLNFKSLLDYGRVAAIYDRGLQPTRFAYQRNRQDDFVTLCVTSDHCPTRSASKQEEPSLSFSGPPFGWVSFSPYADNRDDPTAE